MEVTTLISILSKYGWGGLIAVIIIGILCYIIKYLLKYYNNTMTSTVNNSLDKIAIKITDNINNTNVKLIDSVTETQRQLIDYIKYGQREEHLEHIDRRFDIAEILYGKIKDICNLNHCTRVCIIEFHNSKENLNGLPFAWYDIQYEWQQRNVDTISQLCKNIQAANLLPVIEDLKKNYYVMWNEDDLNNLYDRSSVLYNHLVDKVGAKGMIYLGLYSDNNRLTGLLALEYNYPIPTNIINLTSLKDEAGNISTLLQLQSKH